MKLKETVSALKSAEVRLEGFAVDRVYKEANTFFIRVNQKRVEEETQLKVKRIGEANPPAIEYNNVKNGNIIRVVKKPNN